MTVDLDKLEALLNAATADEWANLGAYVVPVAHATRPIGGSTNKDHDRDHYAHMICRVDGKYQPNEANAALIAAAKNALPALIAQARAARLDTTASVDQPTEGAYMSTKPYERLFGAADTTASVSIGKDAKFASLAGEWIDRLNHYEDSENEHVQAAWSAMVAYIDSRAAKPVQTGVAVDAESFVEWLTREMPAGTVIGDPAWWARRISARATLAPVAAQQAAAVAAPSDEQIIAALHANAIDTYPSKYGFEATSEDARGEAWREGVLMAASTLVSVHDMPTMAASVLGELGLRDADCSALDEFDKVNLRKVQTSSRGMNLRGLDAAQRATQQEGE